MSDVRTPLYDDVPRIIKCVLYLTLFPAYITYTYCPVQNGVVAVRYSSWEKNVLALSLAALAQ